MQFEDWEPIYEEILVEFGFFRDEDEEAARHLQSLLQDRKGGLSAEDLESILRGREVLVCGNAPSLSRDLDDILEESDIEEIAVIAADGATTALIEAGVLPDVIVTDLDGFLPDIIAANERGSAVVVHAHGDNMEALKEYVPRLTRVLGTTQAGPIEGISNFGGFSDGDRCVFLARNFGASKIRIIGFDYDDPDVTPVKKMKLKWARRLVAMALEDTSPFSVK
ncbi:MAG TPA: DUF115 domain-containing protein [Methanotrichaceae archaeon]|nr:DUF115 domain-containing protein [Methanotrichaceae archaeon]